LGNNCVVCIKL